ncbi:hypothetical protein SKAU_G00283340 [Synaphobranchus kaupii]|uniref:Uncharacterized protein n=1 Tax=Synaphobranchus kaupii TaxID=118154 RepID=A0A9Q1EXQ2_SYNKA|nr:hypothetical protein SKAU_G00283340 [Synaphobranchus kaupii]
MEENVSNRVILQKRGALCERRTLGGSREVTESNFLLPGADGTPRGRRASPAPSSSGPGAWWGRPWGPVRGPLIWIPPGFHSGV